MPHAAGEIAVGGRHADFVFRQQSLRDAQAGGAAGGGEGSPCFHQRLDVAFLQAFLQNRNAKREERIRSIMRETGMTHEEVQEDFETKKDNVKGITFVDYYRNKYFNLTEDMIRDALRFSSDLREYIEDES